MIDPDSYMYDFDSFSQPVVRNVSENSCQSFNGGSSTEASIKENFLLSQRSTIASGSGQIVHSAESQYRISASNVIKVRRYKVKRVDNDSN